MAPGRLTGTLPAGTVTFLFTDMEGSTRRWDAHTAAMRQALARHDALLRQAIAHNGGHVFKTVMVGWKPPADVSPGALRYVANGRDGTISRLAPHRARMFTERQLAGLGEPWTSRCSTSGSTSTA